MDASLVKKYNVPGPRYTSYPTVPFWKNYNLNATNWISTIQKNITFFGSKQISIYIHLPFCESLCTFCGCHKHITKNHAQEEPYIEALLKEWNIYRSAFGNDVEIVELHFGGGTPTFFTADNLVKLVQSIFNAISVDPIKSSLSFEAHPLNTTSEHLEKLYQFGFRRLSLGIQSYSHHVQQAINRIQPFETVKKVHSEAKNMGYSSISHDLVYGLPKQTLEDMKDTIQKTLLLMPERISLYSYAHVPWVKGTGQRGYDESDLPQNEVKRLLYDTSKNLLEKAGYQEIGMDHFALKTDELYVAMQQKKLHRNFMGYTTKSTHLMIGLGMSAISDSWFGFSQNQKSVAGYLEQVNSGQFPILRGHILSDEELIIRQHILDLMCHFETKFHPEIAHHTAGILERLRDMIADELVIVENDLVKVSSKGIPFVRNCCMAFDLDLVHHASSQPLFSQTV